MTMWARKDLLGLEELSAAEINTILDTAESLKEVSTRSIKKVPALRGKVVVNLFMEPSTRTRTSFGLAAQRLSADRIDISASGSSAEKGETLKDTARNIEAMGVDILVIRHSAAGAPHMLAKILKASVVNAGDGSHEHPTQGLLDIFTIRDRKKRIKGLRVAIVGDIAHSRVARSNIWGLKKLGAEVIVVGPPTLIPKDVERLGVSVSYDIDSLLDKVDVINLLRIQLERQTGRLFPSIREYSQLFGINSERLKKAKEDVLIMAPGPINRGVEITPDVADGPNSVILEQVTNGLAIRMAVLYLVSGVKGSLAGEAVSP
jgi:aspartate carbamoyltransferase catalytic subunit